MAHHTPPTLGPWQEPEWHDPGDPEAYAASDAQFLVEAEVVAEGNGWFWIVKATSRLSEWPEVQDAGTVFDKDEAMAAAEAAATKATEGRTPRTY